jgi:hypothetical protein
VFQSAVQPSVCEACRSLSFIHSTKTKKKIKFFYHDNFAHAAGPVPLVLDLRIVHERFGSGSYPSIIGHLHYPYDVDRSLNESVADMCNQKTSC